MLALLCQLNDLGHESWIPLSEITSLKYKVVSAPPALPMKIEESNVKKLRNPLPSPLDEQMK